MTSPLIEATYATLEEYAAAFQAEIGKGGLLVKGASLPAVAAMSACRLSIRVAGGAAVEVPARVAAVVPGLGVAVVFEGVPEPLARLADPGAPEESGAALPEEDSAPRGPASERLKALNVAQKMALAKSATREERFALLRDNNKVLHTFVLRNPRIGLDEVQAAAKMSSLSPEALKMIAEHQEWGMNSMVCTGLVRNPRTPMPIALRLLDRIPASEVRAIAKGGARDALVTAARKKINS